MDFRSISRGHLLKASVGALCLSCFPVVSQALTLTDLKFVDGGDGKDLRKVAAVCNGGERLIGELYQWQIDPETGKKTYEKGLTAFQYESGLLTLLEGLAEVDAKFQLQAVSADCNTLVGVQNKVFRYATGQEIVSLNEFIDRPTYDIDKTDSIKIAGIANDRMTLSGKVTKTDGVLSFDGHDLFTLFAGQFDMPVTQYPGGFIPYSRDQSEAAGISADGQITAGTFFAEDGIHINAFRLQGGVYTEIGTLGGSYSEAAAISADGSTIVGIASDADNNKLAFHYKDGKMTSLGDLPGGETGSKALAVSGDGSIVVGTSVGTSGALNPWEPFIWDSDSQIMVSIYQQLEKDGYDIEALGIERLYIDAISTAGDAIAGIAVTPDNGNRAWVARIDLDTEESGSEKPFSLRDLWKFFKSLFNALSFLFHGV